MAEPEYVWGVDDRMPTRARTLRFGKPALLALPALILRDAPPRGGATISPLRGGPSLE